MCVRSNVTLILSSPLIHFLISNRTHRTIKRKRKCSKILINLYASDNGGVYKNKKTCFHILLATWRFDMAGTRISKYQKNCQVLFYFFLSLAVSERFVITAMFVSSVLKDFVFLNDKSQRMCMSHDDKIISRFIC